MDDKNKYIRDEDWNHYCNLLGMKIHVGYCQEISLMAVKVEALPDKINRADVKRICPTCPCY